MSGVASARVVRAGVPPEGEVERAARAEQFCGGGQEYLTRAGRPRRCSRKIGPMSFAGHETTTYLIGNLIWRLLEEPRAGMRWSPTHR